MIKFIRHTLRTTRISLSGIKAAYRQEKSFFYEMNLAVPLFLYALIASFSVSEKILLIAPIFFVLSFELINTSIEKVIDEIGNQRICDNFKLAKDAGSAAVFFMILLTLASWLSIAAPKILSYIM